jgi:hypothetical protein
VIVATGLALSGSEARDLAIWWASVPNAEASSVRWSQGKGVSGSDWDRPRPPVPVDTPLFVFVQGYRRGVLEGVSRSIPFQVGAPWPEPNGTCGSDADCGSPEHAMACLFNRCRLLCLSQGECSPFGLGCAPPQPPFRPFRVCL